MNIETNKKKKQIAILGSTGSIGTQALQAVSYTHLTLPTN